MGFVVVVVVWLFFFLLVCLFGLVCLGFFVLNCHVVKLLLNIYVCISICAALDPDFREASYYRGQWLMQRLVIAQGAENKQLSAQACMIYIYIYQGPPQGSGSIMEDWAKTVSEPEDEEECCERTVSGHGMVVTYVNSQPLLLSAQGQARQNFQQEAGWGS